ncbi:hypothetical protein IPA_02100 [Ignicoccus pacificus DSM 13166]|uniref:Uncharacterized protein n=1 Tax=Ignicoccus pacificus DSM 13166 TaxID=940294 RepID=A0A977KCK0_9CREN|nr:hypothetical protein IPA_02100 [Ignicoccus pacificus DSM 13166]
MDLIKFGRRLRVYEIGTLIAELENLLKKKVDISIYDRSPPSLRYEAMKGIRIYVKEINEFVEDYVMSINEWLDFKLAWERMARSYLYHLRELWKERKD